MYRITLALLLACVTVPPPDSPPPDEHALLVAEERSLEARGFDCHRVTTKQMRKRLKRQGVELRGLDVDHIVPRAKGGADHPSNYRLLDLHVNRSMQEEWGRKKCQAVGRHACAEAVAVSRVCGTYRGDVP